MSFILIHTYESMNVFILILKYMDLTTKLGKTVAKLL